MKPFPATHCARCRADFIGRVFRGIRTPDGYICDRCHNTPVRPVLPAPPSEPQPRHRGQFASYEPREPADAMIGPKEIATLLSISVRQAQELCKVGRFPATNVGLRQYKVWRVKLSEVLKFMNTPTNLPPKPAPLRHPDLPPGIKRRV